MVQSSGLGTIPGPHFEPVQSLSSSQFWPAPTRLWQLQLSHRPEGHSRLSRHSAHLPVVEQSNGSTINPGPHFELQHVPSVAQF